MVGRSQHSVETDVANAASRVLNPSHCFIGVLEGGRQQIYRYHAHCEQELEVVISVAYMLLYN